MSLAQRLNELAVANAEGLLNDDEYRLLRQNVFERFAGSTAVPTEVPVVPSITPNRPQRRASYLVRGWQATSRRLSTAHIEVARPASIHYSNLKNSVANLFRRGSSRQPPPPPKVVDPPSVWFGTSNSSSLSKMFRLPRMLSRKASVATVRTTASQTQAETSTITPRRRLGSDRGPDGASIYTNGPRSTKGTSFRRMAVPPPSSFPTSFQSKVNGRAVGSTNAIYGSLDEEDLGSVREIAQQIEIVEAEATQVMDAFNGLEMTTLTRGQRRHGRPSLKSVDFSTHGGSRRDYESDGRSERRKFHIADDAISTRSGTSIGTTLSLSPSASEKNQRAKSGTPSSLGTNPIPRSGSLRRKNSSSSLLSERRKGRATNAPPVPALPDSVTYSRGASISSSNLLRSTHHLPMNTVPEDDQLSSVSVVTVPLELEDELNEMEDIRRRREEVGLRYEARLEYLRAKLKGAQLHEKLMRK